MFSIYLPSKLLVQLAIHNPEQKYSSYHDDILDKILKKQTKIHIYGDDAAQLINEMRNTVLMDYSDPHCDAAFIYLRYIRNASCQIDNCSDIIKSIEKDNSEILKYNGAFFIFDESVDVDVQKIREEYGILCQSADNIDVSDLRDREKIQYSFGIGEKTSLGWTAMLDCVKDLPCNSLCITDRYLFGGDNYYYGIGDDIKWRYDGIDTVVEVVTSLRHNGLKCKYQINIFVCSENLGKHGQDLERIHKIFREKFGEATLDTIEINIFAIKSGKREIHPDTKKTFSRGVKYFNRLTHDRRLLTPYFRAKASNGICLNRRNSTEDNEDKSIYQQEITISRLFSSGLIYQGCSTDASLINDFCKDFKAFIDDYKHHYKDSYYYDFEPDNHDGKIYKGDYQFMSSNGETDLLKYLEKNKIWLMEYAKE